ncbi:ribosome biogenesis GTP-binding protein YihA/YsxC [Deltaproteobacteria bacterium OttesenSCG-928-K17]|nr:ribosome biogenesis GTP-binding protein YihA/YsxC [Deltaproteobacteria bacterium OttesenSCG-928-K17]
MKKTGKTMGPAVNERPPALEAEFMLSAASAAQFPELRLAEVALLGRSNAGKSSLMNRWLGRKALARVGATPGRTQMVNFFKIVWNKADAPFMLADLPGYGFAAAPKAMVAGWKRLVADYLTSGRPIKTALLMMDIRRDPGPDEFGLLHWLNDLGLSAWLICTKADKLGQTEKSKRLAKIKALLAENAPPGRPPLLFSAITGEGRNKLIEALVDSGLLAPPGEDEEDMGPARDG